MFKRIIKGHSGTTEIGWTSDSEDIEIRATVAYTIEDFDRGGWDSPPEGGELSAYRFEIKWLRINGPRGHVDTMLTREQLGDSAKGWEAELDSIMESDDKWAEYIDTECRKAADDARYRDYHT